MPNAKRRDQMLTVVCGIDESGSPEAVRGAVDYCREHHADLRLVGVVQDKLGDSTRGTAGERVRRSRTVRLELDRAAEAARSAGVTVSTTLRAGNTVHELLREVVAMGSAEVFYVRTRGAIRAALTRQPRREVVHSSVGTPINEQIAVAA
jgi:hypothetical protein